MGRINLLLPLKPEIAHAYGGEGSGFGCTTGML